MKKYMFGKFGIKVPVLKEDRWSDRPLPESSATPYSAKSLSLAELAMQEAGYNRTRMPGQNLVGNMVPTVSSFPNISISCRMVSQPLLFFCRSSRNYSLPLQ